MKRILLIGKNGQVGWELERTLASLGKVVAVDRKVVDLAKTDTIVAAIREVNPDMIVNAAAYTAVDKAESEPELAMAINGIAPGIMAEEARRINA
ncbi:MAG: NAD(P)-dependent oxidoreductase, partial [Gammaproteobacteria bacterium]|nr:NAD(P)-dependent oxidoreductase [Gammaproteobacteria bacterium]